MRIAYAKLGRAVNLSLDTASTVGGDAEVARLLDRLLRAGHEVHVVGNRQGAVPPGVIDHRAKDELLDLPSLSEKDRNVFLEHGVGGNQKLKTFAEKIERAAAELLSFDAWIVWLGQHGNSGWPIPTVAGEGLTRPYVCDMNYVYPTSRLINATDATPIWLCPDPRNYLKLRYLDDPKRAREVLAQYDRTYDLKTWHPRHGVRSTSVRYRYAALELLAVDPSPYEPPYWHSRKPFGIMVNEGRRETHPLTRHRLLREWVLETLGRDVDLVGHWSRRSVDELSLSPRTVPLDHVTDTLGGWCATITFPATFGGWATAKPWECFRAGTVCFAHPRYDDQDHVYGYLEPYTRRFLRPRSPAELQQRVQDLTRLRWECVVSEQLRALERAQRDWDYGYSTIATELEKRA